MRIVHRVLLILLAVYLAASLAASAVYQLSPDIEISRAIANGRYGLLVMGYDPNFDTFFVLSPFCNYSDIFILVVDFTDGIEFRTDGFDFFGEF